MGSARRSKESPSDDHSVNESAAADQGPRLLALYDRAIPQVYGYLAARVNDPSVAEDLTGETFLAAVRAVRGYQSGAFHISSITPPAGIDSRPGSPEVRLYFRVDDIETAAARVRELGGDVLAVTDYDSGGNAECVDDQGLRFDLFRPKPGY
ncbi:MAG: hypothetical protein QOH28_2405 [Actinomycetota bacterium]|jgi:hypothetical protein|nr:hypothetical protein [Actinomycetota bacterium]